MADSQSGGVDLQFEWDDDKAASNLEKHGVSFEEAATVFREPFALIFDDEAPFHRGTARDHYWSFHA